MGILSESSTGTEKFGKHLRRYSSLLSAALYAIGLIYFLIILDPSLNFTNKTYFSENALLPGLADEEFNGHNNIRDALSTLKVVAKPPKDETYYMPIEWLKKQFLLYGLETYVQNFTLKYPLAVSENLTGNNVIGIVRSPRGSPSESIVVAVPYKMDSLPAVSVVLALANFCRGQIYWAKDIIFVISEHAEIGMVAWLNAYHEKFNEYILYESLVARGGAIQAAIVLDTNGESFSYTDIKFNNLDGQLPNLDLVNLAVRMIEKERLIPTIYDQQEDDYSPYHDAYHLSAKTTVLAILQQASGRVEGLHSLFGSFGIEALTVKPVPSRRGGSAGLFEVARVFEGMLRSINNLLERFHQSFFFYLLPSTHSFISIGLYMPAIGLMLLAPLIKACSLWMESNEMVEKETESNENSSQKKDAHETEDKVTESVQIVRKVDNSLLGIIPCILLSHLLGVFVRLSPVYVRLMSGPKSSPDDNLMATFFGLTIALFYFPKMVRRSIFVERKSEIKLPSAVLLRCLALLEMTMIVGVTSVLNFGLGFLLCLTWVPVCTLITPRKSVFLWFAQFVLLGLTHPLVLIFVANLAYLINTVGVTSSGVDFLLRASYDATKRTVIASVLDSYLYGSWQFTLITIGLVPVWTLFATLLGINN